MYFARLAAKDFDSAVRSRGREYYRAGVVDLCAQDTRRVLARVHGTRTYQVAVEVLEDSASSIQAVCTCPFFAQAELCKHIWATFLEIERLGGLEALVVRDRRVYVYPCNLEASDTEDPFRPVAKEIEEVEEIDIEEPVDPSRQDNVISFPPASRTPLSPPPPSSDRTSAFSRWEQELDRASAPRWEKRTREEILYFLTPEPSRDAPGNLARIEIYQRRQRTDGKWGAPSRLGTTRDVATRTTDPFDRRILNILLGGRTASDWYYRYAAGELYDFSCAGDLAAAVLPVLVESGRLFCVPDVARAVKQFGDEPPSPVLLDEGEAWSLHIKVRAVGGTKRFQFEGVLRRGEETLDPEAVLLTLSDGTLVLPSGLSRLDDARHVRWLDAIGDRATRIEESSVGFFLEKLYSMFPVSRFDLPEALRLEESAGAPEPPVLSLQKPQYDPRRQSRLRAVPCFTYAGHLLPADTSPLVVVPESRRLINRDHEAESRLIERLFELGCRTVPAYLQEQAGRTRLELEVASSRVPQLVRTLVAEGWHVEAEGNVYRQAASFETRVSSGVDWFELETDVRFGEESVALPQLLVALERGENHVVLGDGSFGVLPEAWLRRYGFALSAGESSGSAVRFRSSQLALLDLLLAEQDDASWDRTFEAARKKLRSFSKPKPRGAPRSFRGKLRPYQKDGLGWFGFLREFGFGGCLADDMGLGKTIQVLALLESRRLAMQKGELPPKPSLVVAPRSLVFNWRAEAGRFTPKLRVLDFSGPDRRKWRARLSEYDVVLMTYGTLRSEIAHLCEVAFDYVILDEAQAIKNPKTVTAKAARLLRGDHRLALTGTPVENHLGELWSLLEFLNPGFLGSYGTFSDFADVRGDAAFEFAETLRRVIGPMVLRRTKQDVATDLPEKTEKTILCELEGDERRRYDELRDHFRAALLGGGGRGAADTSPEQPLRLGRRKLEVLEALLRLRQASCHPGLIDKDLASKSSAKLDVLLTELRTVLESGHKALVFSQFTSLLAILRKQFDKDDVSYEYLDGRTRRRDLKVERFQNDPDCRLFLISLKAGGVGLNLTAAEYVFLLDPWWNPAVELQAIDRTHRIGQSRRVFAYRLIAKDTVEERVLELQESKRRLADAIVSANGSLLKTLTRDDLEQLLS